MFLVSMQQSFVIVFPPYLSFINPITFHTTSFRPKGSNGFASFSMSVDQHVNRSVGQLSFFLKNHSKKIFFEYEVREP